MKTILMWTINNFSINATVSSWSKHGKMAFPYYMDTNKPFFLNQLR